MKNEIIDVFEKSNGKGWIHIEHLLNETQKGTHIGMYARVVVDVDAGIGIHQHHNDKESYVILEGRARYIDNDGKEYLLTTGDHTFTDDGQTHGIYNAGDIPLVFMALIIKNEEVYE